MSASSSESVHDRVKQRRKQEYRRVILEAAEQVFGQSGYRATKMTEIARAAGVATGTLYNYFDSKEDVFSALLRRVQQELYDRVASAGSDVQGLAKLRAILRETLVGVQQHGRLFAVQLQATTTEGTTGGLDLEAHKQAYQAYVEIVRGAVIDAVDRGELRDDVDPRAMAVALVGSCRASMFEWMFTPPQRPVQELVDPILDLFVEGAGAP